MKAAREVRTAATPDAPELSLGAHVNVACDDDIEQARAIIKGTVGTFAHFSGMSAQASKDLPDENIHRHIGANYDMDKHTSGAGKHMQAVPDAFVSRFAITGPPAHCIERRRALSELGLDRLVLIVSSRDADPALAAASVKRLASEVIPELRRS